MRKFRILACEVIGLAVLVAWLMWKYPELVDDIIPWVALAVAWHLTWEFALDTDLVRNKVQGFGRRVSRMWIWPLVFVIGGCVSLLYWIGINKSLVALAEAAKNKHAAAPAAEVSAPAKRAQLHWYKTYATFSPDALFVGKPLDFSITFLNEGNDKAVRVYGAVTLYFANGKSSNEASFIAAWFEPLWQQKLTQQRMVDTKGRTIDPVHEDVKDEFGMHLHALVVTRALKQKLEDQRQFMWIVGALRYEDASGEHEFQFLRCLLPPFHDLKSWTAETIHEGTIDIKPDSRVDGTAKRQSRNWEREWREMERAFVAKQDERVFAECSRDREGNEDWKIDAEIQEFDAHEYKILCEMAGTLLIKTPTVALSDEVIYQKENWVRWLCFLRAKRCELNPENNGYTLAQTYCHTEKGTRNPVSYGGGILHNLPRDSVNACRACRATTV